ncbi:MAG: hypothetical protein U0931_37300 [Vulcanimicrobiota bacterium]
MAGLLGQQLAARPVGFSYPPDGCILLQHSHLVKLRGKFPKGDFRAELWRASKLVSSQVMKDSSWTVTADPGVDYEWKVFEGPHLRSQGHFMVAVEFIFSADGADGRSGSAGITSQEGAAGKNGGQIEGELRRFEDGMHLKLRAGNRQAHYLFSEPGLRLEVTARGGNGGDGADGIAWHGRRPACGRKGGDAGWGGNLVITTYDAPWRDYLDVDLTPGRPGAGGRGAIWTPETGDTAYAPDGPSGQEGMGGRVETRLAKEGRPKP